MGFTEEQVKSLAPTPSAFNAGKKLSASSSWQEYAKSARAVWGKIKGSGKNPYLTSIDMQSLAYKCSCPSRQFPCKHAVALMLLYGTKGDNAPLADEPEWVSTWLDKRREKQESQDSPLVKEQTEEAKARSEKNKQQTQAKRLSAVKEGANELELWLKDLVRIGLLELSNKQVIEFEKVAKRMVDAKAPGLAGWVRTLGQLDYHSPKAWQDNALRIVAKLYLLLQAIKNYEQLTPVWQLTVKNLAGWPQSSKALLANPEAETVKDHWLVVGQLEETNDDVITQRNWLIGCQSDRQALILNFATRFSSFETTLLPGVVIEAELAFFPSVLPFRAVVKKQHDLFNELLHYPNTIENWEKVHHLCIGQIKVNPWANEYICILEGTRLVNLDDAWFVMDSEDRLMAVEPSLPREKCLQWLALTGNRPVNFAGVISDEIVRPLGVFIDNNYKLL